MPASAQKCALHKDAPNSGARVRHRAAAGTRRRAADRTEPGDARIRRKMRADGAKRHENCFQYGDGRNAGAAAVPREERSDGFSDAAEQGPGPPAPRARLFANAQAGVAPPKFHRLPPRGRRRRQGAAARPLSRAGPSKGRPGLLEAEMKKSMFGVGVRSDGGNRASCDRNRLYSQHLFVPGARLSRHVHGGGLRHARSRVGQEHGGDLPEEHGGSSPA